jgi:hypothetical protein
MPEATTTVPSQALRDDVANVTEEGLELVRRVIAFAADTRRAERDFAAEAANVATCRHRTAAVRSGLGVLHALVVQMADALAEAHGDGVSAVPDESAAA